MIELYSTLNGPKGKGYLLIRFNPQLNVIYPYIFDSIHQNDDSLVDLVIDGFESVDELAQWSLGVGYCIPNDFIACLKLTMTYSDR